AILAAVEIYKKERHASRVVFWVPAYFCNEALEPLRSRCPWLHLNFYDIEPDLKPCWDSIRPSSAETTGIVSLLMIVHFFGFPNSAKEAMDFAREHGMALIEDSAHVLEWIPETGLGDFVIFSPHKLLAIPQGAFLTSRHQSHRAPVNQSVGSPGIVDWRWLAKRLMQRLLVGFGVSWHQMNRAVNGSVHWNDHGSGGLGNGDCSDFSLKLLDRARGSLQEIKKIRRRNYEILLERLGDLKSCRILFPDLPQQVCPYAFALLADGPLDRIVSRLNGVGVPASRWPDLAPEVMAQGGSFGRTIAIYEKLFLLPVHQSICEKQARRMADLVSSAIGPA
ncbi:MAG: DegT/DnrJ/EryC1/StrS aminotransferase family protein, partial [Elusimicrobia bacterium]|nr:DegT/DnrJ/EryC1/StrS aminotransferase family protein [Elusimicrobiota bacterium]